MDYQELKSKRDRACDELDAAIAAFEQFASAPAVIEADVTKARKRMEAAQEKAENASTMLELSTKTGRSGGIRVDEPDLYQKGGRSFIADLYASQLRGDALAAVRISKHQQFEIDRIAKAKGEEFAVATGTLGGVIPPQYMVELYAKAQRFGRVFADQVRHEDLPEIGMSIIVPRLTGGLAAGIQTSESSTVSTQDPTETDLTVPVRTIAGYSPVSRQTLERAAYSDTILFEDLCARYFATLDTQLISGSGSSGQHLGVLNVSGISTATVSSWSAANAWGALVGETGLLVQIALWAATVGSPADKIFMHPRRWGAFLGLLDSQNRPLVVPDPNPNFNAMGEGSAADYGRVGTLGGVPVFTDANIPTNLGTNTNADAIIAIASQAVLLWEREDDPVTLAFEQQAGTSLQVQLVAYGYSAFTAGRYPAASGAATGVGLN
jgi:HK97 family phage major capsid protein